MPKRRTPVVLNFNRQVFGSRAPGESLVLINGNMNAENRKRREVRRRIEAIAERRELERETEGDW